MTDLVLAFMAMCLGAALLAIVLLYKGYKKNRDQITELRAQLAAQQIAALTGGVSVSHDDDDDDDDGGHGPIRRKRHLSLFMGSGAVAAVTALADRIRNAVRSHRAFTITATTTVATAVGAAALYITSNGDTSNNGAAPTSPGPGQTRSSPPAPGPTSPPRDPGPTRGGEPSGLPTLPLLSVPGLDDRTREEPAPSTSGPRRDQEPGGSAPSSTEGPLTPAPSTPTPEQPPTPPEPEPTGGQEGDSLLCISVPPLIELCLLDKR